MVLVLVDPFSIVNKVLNVKYLWQLYRNFKIYDSTCKHNNMDNVKIVCYCRPPSDNFDNFSLHCGKIILFTMSKVLMNINSMKRIFINDYFDVHNTIFSVCCFV